MSRPLVILWIVVSALLLSTLRLHAQGSSSRGTEFWTAYTDHTSGAAGSSFGGSSQMVLYITSDIATTGNVEVADGSFNTSYTVKPGEVTFVNVPGTAFMGAGGLFYKGIHITAARPVAVYAHINNASVSGATLLLPVNNLGKEYISINYTQIANDQKARSNFSVIATEDSTTVDITPVADLMTGQPGGVKFSINLKKGEVYQCVAAGLTDLTGSIIKSVSSASGTCKRIAVFSGSSKIGIACLTNTGSNLSSDNLFQQVYPTAAWGRKYITVPLRSRHFDIYRIVLKESNTQVKLNGAVLPFSQLINNLYYQFTSQTSNVIEADKQIQVVQYTATQSQAQDCSVQRESAGDPEMIFLSPVEQGLNKVTLYSTGYYRIIDSYINVVIPTSASSSFTIDGAPYNNFIPVSGQANYSYAQIPVTSGPDQTGLYGRTVAQGTHVISASEPFNAIAYGFGQAESYGYAAGTNLQDLSNFLAFQDPQKPDTTISNACQNIDYKLQLTLSYQTTKIEWFLGNGNAPYITNNPIPKKTVQRAGKTLYVYEYPNKVIYPPGTTNDAIAKVTNPVADECGSTQDFVFTFIVNALPKAKIGLDSILCAGSPTVFRDATEHPSGAVSKKWLWDFGDNTSSTEKAPAHSYAAPGTYYARLTVTDENGCTDISDSVLVHIAKNPVAGFTISSPKCVTKDIVFTSTATSPEGPITKWTWDFGDGTVSTLANGAPVSHVYTRTGSFIVKLAVATSFGCTQTATQTIKVTPIPVVDFSTPQICENDYQNNISAQFISQVAIADTTEADLTYLWDFGDVVGSSPDNPNTSQQKNGSHKYTKAGNYVVTLRVLSKFGCETVVTKTFTVSTAPKPKFTFKNDCSDREIVFKDASTIDIGSINKVVFWFDYANHPERTDTITSFPIADIVHKYDTFSDKLQPTQYVVRMLAYSGQSVVCSQDYTETVTVYPTPKVNLLYGSAVITDTIIVCEKESPFQIIENKGIFTGAGRFSGIGISTAGLFSPRSAGPGLFPITYTFTANTPGACPFVKTFYIRVNPTPRATVDEIVTILSGNSVVLNAKAAITSGNMTYHWSPAIGLDRTDLLKPTASPLKDITYTLIVGTDKGCDADSVQIMVKVLQPPVIPNTFTPNGDGVNDTWEIKNLETYSGATVEVFNRYGERVFSSVGYARAWDGNFNNTALPNGTYYYIVSPKNGRKAVSGYIAIIR